jgi:RNA polymerase sigma factor (sigma-70 family)
VADEGGGFEVFVAEVEPRLRKALVATYGAQVGREATLDALAYAWEYRARMETWANPTGYLYRVGQTSARRQLRPLPLASPVEPGEPPTFEPGLGPALAALSEQQRAAFVLVHGYGWTLQEVAGLSEVSVSTVRSHLDRALRSLRKALEADHVG